MLVITIYDGDVNATSTKGCAIGGEGAEHLYLPDINFYGGTVSAQGATKAMNNYYIYKEKLTIAPYMMASTGDDPNSLTGRSVEERINACRSDKCALVKLCNHEHLIYTTTAEGHTINCGTCSVYASSSGPHTFSAETHLCTVCGYGDPQYYVDVVLYKPLSDGSGYTTETQSVPENSSYKLPTCGVAFAGMEFVGWQQVSSGDDLPEIMSSVISGNVLYVGTQFTVTEKLYFVPRYRKSGPYAVYNTIDSTLRFYNDEYFLDNISESTTSFGLNDDGISPGWISDSYRNNITNVLFTSSFKTTRPTSMNNWFALPNLRSIEGLENLNTSEVTNMDELFYGNSSLPYIDVSSFDMKSVSTKSQMFVVEGNAEKILIYLPKGTKESDFSGYSSGQFQGGYNIVETTDGRNYTCSDYRIFDGSDITVPIPFTATTATFEREFTQSRRSTVFLPFAFDTRAYGNVYSFSGELMSENAGIRFDLMPEGTTVANTPYIIDPDVTTITVETENVEVMVTQATAITESNQMVGVYTRGYVPLNAYCYDASDGQLKRVVAENAVTIKAGRAYFHLADAVVANANVLNAIFDDDVTGIEKTVADERNDSQSAFYTLDGQKINGKPTSNGIYIHNGKKFVVK